MGNLGETQRVKPNSSQIYENIKNENARFAGIVNRKKSLKEKMLKNNRKLYILRQIVKLGPEEFNLRQRLIRYKYHNKHKRTETILKEIRELNEKLSILNQILEARK